MYTLESLGREKNRTHQAPRKDKKSDWEANAAEWGSLLGFWMGSLLGFWATGSSLSLERRCFP